MSCIMIDAETITYPAIDRRSRVFTIKTGCPKGRGQNPGLQTSRQKLSASIKRHRLRKACLLTMNCS